MGVKDFMETLFACLFFIFLVIRQNFHRVVYKYHNLMLSALVAMFFVVLLYYHNISPFKHSLQQKSMLLCMYFTLMVFFCCPHYLR